MATYHVSTQRGDDAHTLQEAQDPATPWKTITKAAQSVVAGDTVYIGPGTYREKPTLQTAGTAVSKITWIGDPDVAVMTGDIKGRVRITGCGADEKPTTGTVWNFNSKDYNVLKRVWVDGNLRADTVYLVAGLAANCECHNVTAQFGSYGFTGGKRFGCVALVSGYGFAGSAGLSERCLAWTLGNYPYSSGTARECVGIRTGDGPVFNSVTTYGCLGMGLNTTQGGGVFRDGVHRNDVAISGSAGFGGYTDYTAINCTAILGSIGFQSDLGTRTNCTAINCTTPGTGVTEGPAVLFDWARLTSLLEPWFRLGILNNGDATGISALDLLARPRQMGDGTVDRGPWEFSTVELQWAAGGYHTNPPGLKISRKGMQCFELPAKGGHTTTIRAQAKHLNTTGDKPQLLVGRILADGTWEEIDSATMVAAADTWEQLEVMASPTVDELLQVRLYARDTGATAYALFSDVDVS